MPVLNDDQVSAYHRDGYVIVRGMFDAEEIDLLSRTARADKALDENAVGREDADGAVARLTLWNHPGDDIYGMFARGRRIVDSMERLLAGEVYHYHSKMILKDPMVGGAWSWHQDYGYWYHNHLLYPLLSSVMIAVDEATRENGCLEVLKGSQLMGRIDHVQSGEQQGAELERLEQAEAQLEVVACELKRGDAVFFHCNTLHRSGPNRSPAPRWALICCYNAARNNPYRDGHHASYTPLVKVEDRSIMEVGLRRFAG